MTVRAVLAGAVAATTIAAGAQTLNPSARETIKLARPLTEAETAAVLAAARAAIDGRIVHGAYSADGPGPDVLMRSDGRPRLVRSTSGRDFTRSSATNGSAPVVQSGHEDVLSLVHYTGRLARGCDGSSRTEELVLEYEDVGKGWTVRARTRGAFEPLWPALDILAGAAPAASGAIKRIDAHTARGFVARYTLPERARGGPPTGTNQILWIDVDSMLPVRWTLAIPAQDTAPSLPEFGLWFTYPTGVVLEPPDVKAPDCVR